MQQLGHKSAHSIHLQSVISGLGLGPTAFMYPDDSLKVFGSANSRIPNVVWDVEIAKYPADFDPY
jgi:hypothetical protein